MYVYTYILQVYMYVYTNILQVYMYVYTNILHIYVCVYIYTTSVHKNLCDFLSDLVNSYNRIGG